MSLSRRNFFAVVLVMGWLVAMAAAFWWFQFSNVRAFDETGKSLAFFQGEQLADSARLISVKGQAATVFHFWDEECGCERFNRSHVQKLIEHYASKGVKFVVVARNAILAKKARTLFKHPAVMEVRDQWPANVQPPSSPAVLITDTNGELAYFGPYSIGAVCTAGQGDFVEKALDKLVSGKNPKMMNTMAVGCFCPWQKNHKNEV